MLMEVTQLQNQIIFLLIQQSLQILQVSLAWQDCVTHSAAMLFIPALQLLELLVIPGQFLQELLMFQDREQLL